MGGEAKYYLMCEMYYDNHETLKAGLRIGRRKSIR